MYLNDLLNDLNISFRTEENINISGITSDSRLVEKGFIFFALSGENYDGKNYIHNAILAGAVAVFIEQSDREFSNEIQTIFCHNIRKVYARAVSLYYNNKPEKIVAVTGTNGKTSVAEFCRQIWQHLGYTSASIGTLGVVCDSFTLSSALTTPDPIFLHKACEKLVKYKIKYLALEASSHGLSQYRLEGLNIDVAGFTNIGRDHLDYHGSMERYFGQKKRLFSDLLVQDGTAVLNGDVKESDEIKKLCLGRGNPVFTYGYNGKSLKLVDIIKKNKSTRVDLLFKGKLINFHTSLIGDFQIMNLLCSIGLVLNVGIEFNDIVEVLDKIRPIPGRLEYIDGNSKDISVYVDYAHTPEALKNVLLELRFYTKGKLVVLFGAGGDRDLGKRILMGEVANEFADLVYITDDNPRMENPNNIRKDILKGCASALEVADRSTAIKLAISNLNIGDVLLIAGKGHETSQFIGNISIPFSDKKTATEILNDTGPSQ